MTEDDRSQQRPLLRVVRGNPDDAELAALTAVVAGMASRPDGERNQPTRRSRWGDPAHQLRAPLHAGPGAWRASSLPR